MHHTSVDALSRLTQGNQRFLNGLRSTPSSKSLSTLKYLSEAGQSPYGIILTCSDSRLSTELLFDCDLGDLFVIRVAGAVTSRAIIGSIEYAAEVLGAPLCIIMGHTDCGAMKAALDVKQNRSAALSPSVQYLTDKIRPSIDEVLKREPILLRHELIEGIALEHVKRNVNKITEESHVLAELKRKNSFRVIGALCDVTTGRVHFDLESQFQTTHWKEDSKPAQPMNLAG